MKRLIAIIAVVLVSACSDPESAKEVLHAEGYTDIEITGYDWTGCGRDDSFHTGFNAISPGGTKVTGVVCMGWFKGSTVRLY